VGATFYFPADTRTSCGLTDDVLWPATRRAEERQMRDKDTSRRGPVQSNGSLWGYFVGL